jgi:hypothetical protein
MEDLKIPGWDLKDLPEDVELISKTWIDYYNNGAALSPKIEIPVEYQEQICSAEIVQIVILQPAPTQKHFPPTGIIAQLTANPMQISGFKPLTREEANKRW